MTGMIVRNPLVLLGLVLAMAGSLARADQAGLAIPVAGEVTQPLTVDETLMRTLPRQSVEARDHGAPARFEGVWLRDVLDRAGAPLGSKLRGPALALCVRIGARDGYVAAFALAELDPDFRDKPILLADRRNGQPLGAEEGPLRVVVADEARGARWVRQVERIDVVSLRQTVPRTEVSSSAVQAQ